MPRRTRELLPIRHRRARHLAVARPGGRFARLVCALILTGCSTGDPAPDARAATPPCPLVKPHPPDGLTWKARAPELTRLTRWHRHENSVAWRLSPDGVVLCGTELPVTRLTRSRLEWIARVWRLHGPLIAEAARKHAVPAELIVTIIVNESGGRPDAINTYGGYVSDRRTPNRISVGLGQMLIGTARAIMNDRSIDRAWLSNPKNAIDAIAVYLDRQYRVTRFDPPLVAAAYNAGALYRDPSGGNRWKLRNHPPGGSTYIDLFVSIVNGSIRHLRASGEPPENSYAGLFSTKRIRPSRRPD